MKTLIVITMIISSMITSFGQVVSNVNWELEGNEQIVITYDLAKEDSYIYFDVSVKISVDNETIIPKALSGDVGSFVKVGTNKKIVWNIFQDLTELNGALSVEVIAFNPVPSGNASKTGREVKEPTLNIRNDLPAGNTIPFWVGMGSVGATGIGLMMGGIKSSSEGKDLYDIYKENRSEGSAVYDELGTSRNDVYDEANKKYRNGSLLTAAGGAIILAAGVIMVNRIIQMKKIQRRPVSFTPFIRAVPEYSFHQFNPQGGVTVTYRFN